MMKRSVSTMVLAAVVGMAMAGWHVAAAKERELEKPQKQALPAEVAAAIQKAFGKAAVGEIEKEWEKVTLYEVKLRQYGAEFDVKVAEDGTIVEVETEVGKELPKAVARVLANQAKAAKVTKVERQEIHAVLKLVKLDRPKVTYEAKMMKDGKEIELKISEDGKVISSKIEEEEGDDDKDEHRAEGKDKDRAKDKDADKAKGKDKDRAKDKDEDRAKDRSKAKDKDDDEDEDRDEHKAKGKDKDRAKDRDKDKAKGKDKDKDEDEDDDD